MAIQKKKRTPQPPTPVVPEAPSVWFRAAATYVDESGDSFSGHVFVEQKNGISQSVKVRFPQGVPWRTEAWSIEAESGSVVVDAADAESAESWLKRQSHRSVVFADHSFDRVVCRGIDAVGGRNARAQTDAGPTWSLPGGWPVGENYSVGAVAATASVTGHGLATFDELQPASRKGSVAIKELGFDTLPRSMYTGWAQVGEAIRVLTQGDQVKVFGQSLTLTRALEVWNFAGNEAAAFTATVFIDPRSSQGGATVPEIGGALRFEPKFLIPTSAGNTVTYTHKVWYKDGSTPAVFVGFLRIRRNSAGAITGQDWWLNHAVQVGLTQWVLSPFNRVRIDPVDADITKTFTTTLPSGSWYTCSSARIN